jgi:hypothetical protein
VSLGRPAIALLAAAAVLLASSAAAVASLDGAAAPRKVQAEHWRLWWGQAQVSKTGATLWSQAPSSPEETHSALLTSSSTWGDQTISFATTTLGQLRTGSDPNSWEVGWVMFHFRDLANYYYFILKTNGFELGKKQGSDAQIFLSTGALPGLVVGQRYRIQVWMQGARIRVSVDGAQVLDFTDPNPLPAGAVGLYEEDSRASFDSLAVSDL